MHIAFASLNFFAKPAIVNFVNRIFGGGPENYPSPRLHAAGPYPQCEKPYHMHDRPHGPIAGCKTIGIHDEKMCHGVHIMAIGKEELVPEIMAAAGLS